MLYSSVDLSPCPEIMTDVLASSNENRIHFIDDGKIELALHQIFFIYYHIIAQVIKTKLVICAVCYIRKIRLTPLLLRYPVYYTANRKAEECIKFAHPLAVALSKIIVDGYYMYTFSVSAFKYAGSVATSVFPSPVFISAILP